MDKYVDRYSTLLCCIFLPQNCIHVDGEVNMEKERKNDRKIERKIDR